MCASVADLLYGLMPGSKITAWVITAAIEYLPPSGTLLDDTTFTAFLGALDVQANRLGVLAIRIGGTSQKSTIAADPDDHVGAAFVTFFFGLGVLRVNRLGESAVWVIATRYKFSVAAPFFNQCTLAFGTFLIRFLL